MSVSLQPLRTSHSFTPLDLTELESHSFMVVLDLLISLVTELLETTQLLSNKGGAHSGQLACPSLGHSEPESHTVTFTPGENLLTYSTCF